ncbi:BMP family lipoprotein [Virgibacillus sp. W0430]|uniref:BMP family lipoprotein n=1 Tax=Virgibacillus sp. W0430 TaxID=3391580 RepID=UPI003F446145
MNWRKYFFLSCFILILSLFLAACGSSNEEDSNKDEGSATEEETTDEAEGNDEATGNYTAAMVTDTGGVDDKSFNQSAWEGLTAWGEEHGLEKGKDGFDYAQSEDDSDYLPNFTRLVRNDFDIVFGIGFLLEDAVREIAQQNPENEFAIVDTVVDEPNVASITFAEHQGSFLVGVVAAMTTKTNKVGFVGGVDSDLINKFEVGFVSGVKSVDPNIEINIQYAEDFSDAAKGKLIATQMYNDGADIIYHAAGGTGNGVFAQAKDIKQNDPDRDIWVIGVDRDQYEEGLNEDGSASVTLTSMVKRVDISVHEVTNLGMNGEFPGGEIIEFGLEDEGVGIATTNEEALSTDVLDAVKEWEDKIKAGEITVPKTRDELKEFEDSL